MIPQCEVYPVRFRPPPEGLEGGRGIDQQQQVAEAYHAGWKNELYAV
jgi:hypothetical protein